MKMTSKPNRYCWSWLLGLLLLTGCALPQHFWPQKDIVGSDVGTIPGQPEVLIASRSSEYKKQLVAELQKRLSTAKISHKTIGIKQLDKVDPTGYAAVVIINTCLAWGLDNEVSTFLDSRKRAENIILLTTSGEGSWLPDKHGLEFDAISGASLKTNISAVARDLMERIQRKL